jgi:hypothetical protein
MSDIRVLIVVDGIFSLTTTYPIDASVPPFGPGSDPIFGLSYRANQIQYLRLLGLDITHSCRAARWFQMLSTGQGASRTMGYRWDHILLNAACE